jgi:hypothetical protein
MARTKVTVELPADLLKRARASTGEGITGTIRRGLEMVAAARAQERMIALRGKVRFSMDLAALRRDRGMIALHPRVCRHFVKPGRLRLLP